MMASLADLIEQQQTLVRLGGFFALLGLMLWLENRIPNRPRRVNRLRHALHNIGLILSANLVLRLLSPLAAVGAASWAAQQQLGLFNQLNWALGWQLLICLLALDLIIYWQHRLFHRLPWLWRLHRVHHSDLDLDVTSGARFHPLEILLSVGIKMAAVTLLGAPIIAVILFEVLLNGMAMFNHSNIRLPKRLDQRLRSLLVTPAMHLVHHSLEPQERDNNYGFNLSLWDRWFGSYLAEARAPLVIGVRGLSQQQSVRLDKLLLQPLLPLALENVPLAPESARILEDGLASGHAIAATEKPIADKNPPGSKPDPVPAKY